MTITVKRNYVYPITVRLEIRECGECGIVWGLPEDFLDRRRADGKTFHCPNGHPRVFRETEEDRQRARANRAEQQARWAREERDAARQLAEHERRSAAAYKGHLTRVRKRIANGVCPVPGCKRSGFDRVMAHIASQHPGWLHDHPEIQEHAS